MLSILSNFFYLNLIHSELKEKKLIFIFKIENELKFKIKLTKKFKS